MSYSLESSSELTALANAIRAKSGDSNTMTVAEMAVAVSNLSSGASGYIMRKEFYETSQADGVATEIVAGSYLDLDLELARDKEFIFLITMRDRDKLSAPTVNQDNAWMFYYDGSALVDMGLLGNKITNHYPPSVSFSLGYDSTTQTNHLTINNDETNHTYDINLAKGSRFTGSKYIWGWLFYLSENYNEIPPVNVHNLVSANESGSNSALYDALFDRLTFVPTSGNMNNFMNNAKNHPMTSVDWRNKVIDLSSTPDFWDGYNMEHSFFNCSIKYLPKIIIPANTAFNIRNINALFSNSDLVEMRSDFFPAGTGMVSTRASGVVRGNQFNYCYRLRSIPEDFLAAPYYLLDNAFYNANGSNMNYYRFNCCYVLKKVLGAAYPSAPTTKITANHFQYTFNECMCLHRVTFYKPNGSVGTMNATNQTVDLSKCGYWRLGGGYDVTTYLNQYLEPGDSLILINSAATATTANVENENSYATEVQYSTYTRKSAVETINSLPDTTGAGGGNTIMFASGAGSAYGTAYDMSELTAAEIAVATAKGWTVTLV